MGRLFRLNFKTVLDKHAEVVAGAGTAQQVCFCRILGIGAGRKVLSLCEQLYGIAGVTFSKVNEVTEVYIGCDVTVPGQGRQFCRAELCMRFVAAQGAARTSMVQCAYFFSVVNGDEDAAFPERLP